MSNKTIIDLLLEDHEEFRELFKQYPDDPQSTFAHLKRDLTLHTKLEEAILYPAVAEFAPDKAQHYKEEHYKADLVVQKLSEDPGNERIFHELQDLILHHVDQEEEDLFPLTAETLGAEKIEEMGEQGRIVKERILREGI